MNRTQQFFINGLLLTATALLLRAVGMVFNIYVSRKVGAQALGLYSLLSGIYGFTITVAVSGISLGTTRLVADAVGEGRACLTGKCMKSVWKHCFFFGTLSAALLFFCAPAIGKYLLRDVRTITSLRVCALTLLPIAISAALGGYFTAVRRVYKNALVQVLSHAIRLTATVAFLLLLLPKGLEYACLALVLGGALSEGISCALSLLLYFYDRKRHGTSGESLAKERRNISRSLDRKLLSITLPVALSTYIRSGLLALEHMLIPVGLERSGLAKGDALAAYGVLGSMALPVILLPAAFIQSYSGLLVPEFAECRVQGDSKRQARMMDKVFLATCVFSIGVAAGILCFSGEIGEALFGSATAALYIRQLAPLIPVMYLDTMVDAMLKGIGEQVYSMNVNIADAALSVLLVWLILPAAGVEGYIAVILISEIFNMALSLSRLLKKTGGKMHPLQHVFIPLFCAMGAAALTSLTSHLTLSQSGSSSLTALSLQLFTAALLYVLLLALFLPRSLGGALFLRKQNPTEKTD